MTAAHSDLMALKPCPFCGEDALELAGNRIGCSDRIGCAAVGPDHVFKRVTRDAWNTRAQPDREAIIRAMCSADGLDYEQEVRMAGLGHAPSQAFVQDWDRYADAILSALTRPLGGFVQGSIGTKQPTDPEGSSRTETAGWQPIESAVADHVVLVCNPDEGALPVVAMKVEDTWYQHDLRGTALTPAPKFWMRWPKMPRSTEAVADTDADAQRDDGLLSGVSADPTPT